MRAIGAGFPVALTYGLTEACSQVATAPPEETRAEPSLVGSPLPGVEVCLGADREIMVRGPTVALGYVGSEEPLTDALGWLHTGDLGELNDRSRLRVTGRKTDRIVTGGVNVDPLEVEEVLRSHRGVADVCVLGIPDEEWGELVTALVVPAPRSRVDASELIALARARLSRSKVPGRIAFVAALPRNPSGKVDSVAARRRLVESSGPDERSKPAPLSRRGFP